MFPRWLTKKRQDLIRHYTSVLCSREWPASRRRYLLYLILRPALGRLIDTLIEHGLEPDEAESEIFILVCQVFMSYDTSESCFLYHVEKSLPARAQTLLKRFAKEETVPFATEDEAYEIENEFYLSIPGILFEQRWLVRDLSQYEKTIILRVLAEDRPGRKALANSCQVGESTIERDLHILAGKLKGRLSPW